MTLRYNPQSIEKQVRKWPVFFSETEIQKDTVLRLKQIIGDFPKNWINPYSVVLPYEKDIIYEYGIDACRIATINSNDNIGNISLLEPAYKWIAKLHYFLSYDKDEKYSFGPFYWLKALVQLQDHIISRNSPRIALALVMKAVKLSPPNSKITEIERALVAACLFPFIPVYVASKIKNISEIPNLKDLLNNFDEYICTKVALEKGGWHWEVFNREKFENDPISELGNLKWVKKAIKNKNIELKEEGEGGIRICFS